MPSDPSSGGAAQDELAAMLEAVDEERAASDWLSRLRIVDPVPPDLRQILAGERVSRKDPAEEEPPSALRSQQNDVDGLRIGARTLRTHWRWRSSPSGRSLRIGSIGEHEVPRHDRYAVAPARLGANAVAKREGRLPYDLPAGKVRSEVAGGVSLKAPMEHAVEIVGSTRDRRTG